MSAAKRIVLLVPSMQLAGGCERVVHNLSGVLTGLGHHVAIATFDDSIAQWHFQGEGERFALGSFTRRPLPLRWLEIRQQVSRLARFKRQFRPDLTISNLWRADLISALSGGSDRKVAIAHINVVGNPTNRLMVQLRGLVGRIYRRFDRVVAVSKSLAEELSELYRLDPRKGVAINNFAKVPVAQPRLPKDGIRRAVWCGRLVTEKNLAGLLEVWRRLCDEQDKAQLVVLGDGPLRPELEARAAELGLRLGTDPADAAAQVVFMGNVDTPADYQASARVFIMSSLAEGMPMVLLEALTLGSPVIAADCPAGGVRAVLCEDGAATTACGALLPIPLPGDGASQSAWLPWLNKAMTDDAQLAQWSEAALRRAESFSPARAAKDWQALIEDVTG